MARMSKTERSARDGLLRNLIYLSQENWIPDTIEEEVPEEWHSLLHQVDVAEKKQKLTLYLDRSVAKFFRDMGVGYQARINRVLATFAQMHVTRHIKLEERLRKEFELGVGPGLRWSEWDGMMRESPVEKDAPAEEAPDKGAPAEDQSGVLIKLLPNP